MTPNPEQQAMSERAKEFVEANAKSPVVYGSAIGNGGKGAYYRLANGQRFRLNREDCAAVGMPRWLNVE